MKTLLYSLVFLIILGFNLNAQVFEIGDLTSNSACAGSNFSVNFTVSSSFSTDNIFTVQLSDEDGDFSSPATLDASLEAYATGNYSIDVTIPESSTTALAYRVRVHASDPESNTSSSNPFTIYSLNISDAPDGEICYDESIVIGVDNPVYNGSGNYSYLWTSEPYDSGLAAQNTTVKPTVSPTETTVYTLTVTDNNTGCELSDDVTVTVHPLPVPEIDGSQTACIGSTITYSTDANEGSSYSWEVALNGETLTTNSNSEFDLTIASSGTYTVNVMETSEYGCESSDEFTTVVLDIPAITFGNESTEICIGSETRLNPAVNGGTGEYTYSWLPIDGLDNSTAMSPTANPTETTNYILTVTDGNGCQSSNTITVVVNPLPIAEIHGTEEICLDNETVYSAYVSEESVSYTWSVENGTPINEDNTSNTFGVLWTTRGSGTVTLQVTCPTGCSETFRKEITVNGFKPEIRGDELACLNETYTFSTVANSGSSFTWSVEGGEITNGQGSEEITVSFSSIGEAEISVMEVNDGCMFDDIFAVEVVDIPAPRINGPGEVCAEVNASYSTELVEGNEYDWYISGGDITSGQGTNEIVVVWETGAEEGLLELTETNENDCENVTDFTVMIEDNPAPRIEGTTRLCVNDRTHEYWVTDNRNDYRWTVTNGIIQSGQGTGRIEVEWQNVGEGYLEVTETSELGCFGSDDFDVEIMALPTPEISGKIDVCAYENSVRYQTNSVGGHSYSWIVDGGNIVSGQNSNAITVNWDNSGVGRITVRENVTGLDECYIEDTYTVEIHAHPVPDVMGETVVCALDEEVEYSTEYVSGNSYVWTVSGGDIVDGQNTNTIKVDWSRESSGRVSVKEEDIYGCETETYININILPLPDVKITGDNLVFSNQKFEYTTKIEDDMEIRWEVDGGTILGNEYTGNLIKVRWGSSSQSGEVRLWKRNTITGCEFSSSMDIDIEAVPRPIIYGEGSVWSEVVYVYRTLNSDDISSEWTIENGTILGDNDKYEVRVVWDVDEKSGKLTLKQRYTGSDAEAEISKDVIILKAPAPSIAGDENVCVGKSYTYSTDLDIEADYEWTATGGTIQGTNDGKSVDVIWNTPGSASIEIAVVNTESGYNKSGNKDLTVVAAPNADINGDNKVCISSASTFDTDPSSDYTNTWTVSGGAISGSANGSSVTIDWTTTGTAKVALEQVHTITGCSSLNEFEVEVYPEPTVEFTMISEICENEEAINLNGTPANGNYTGDGVSENNKFDPSVAGVGTHTITYTYANEGGCEGTAQATIVVNPAPEKPGIVLDDLDDLKTTAAGDIQWYLDGNAITGATTDTHIPTETGNYTVVVTNTFGCSKESDELYVDMTGVEDAISGISLYPNPAQDKVKLNIAVDFSGKVNVEIINVMGEAVISSSFEVNGSQLHETIDLDNLSSGSYLVRIQIGSEVITDKIIVNK